MPSGGVASGGSATNRLPSLIFGVGTHTEYVKAIFNDFHLGLHGF